MLRILLFDAASLNDYDFVQAGSHVGTKICCAQFPANFFDQFSLIIITAPLPIGLLNLVLNFSYFVFKGKNLTSIF